MAVACAFDQWREDVFFPAAEAVQESADIMQSTYRMWLRKRAEVSGRDVLEELCKELQTALGTAKWQLEEFERAISTTHNSCSSEDDTARRRHTEFVEAIDDQISQVENALKDSLMDDKKQQLRWVQLDDEECSELAAFLSATSSTEQREANCSSPYQGIVRPVSVKDFREISEVGNNPNNFVQQDWKEKIKNHDYNVLALADGQRRTWSSPDITDWKIVIHDTEGSKGKLLKSKLQSPWFFTNLYGLVKNSRISTKLKWSRRNIQGDRGDSCLSSKQSISSYLDLRTISRVAPGRTILCETDNTSSIAHANGLGAVAGFMRPSQGLRSYSRFKSLRVTSLLLLAIFLIAWRSMQE